MWSVRDDLDKAHVALAFLLVVLGGSAAGGRALGMSLSIAAFFVFNWVFLPPFNTFVISNPLDWLVLITFLITGLVAAQLLEWRKRETDAEARAEGWKRADQLKDALLASVSHDLRTPLTAIKGIANEIWTGGDAERAQVLEEEADRLSALVDDLLELSQINAGGMRVRTALNTVDDLVGAALERVEAAHREQRINVRIEHEGGILVGEFDFAQAMRALTNLLENALKYSPVSSRVLLRVWRAGELLHFAVEDDGPGVPAGEEEKIFEPFYRGHATADRARGTGLGLSIARQLVVMQGGVLTYERRRSEGGSRFAMTLPARDPA